MNDAEGKQPRACMVLMSKQQKFVQTPAHQMCTGHDMFRSYHVNGLVIYLRYQTQCTNKEKFSSFVGACVRAQQ